MTSRNVPRGTLRGWLFTSSEMISASVTSVLSSFVALSMIWTSSPARTIAPICWSVT
jgi:hypothetical protein